MLVRYHLIFYAIGCLWIVLGQYFHPLFYIFFLFYILWLYKRFDYRYVIVMLILSICLFNKNITIEPLPQRIQGTVIKTSDKYCYVKMKQGVMKMYHESHFSYGDDVDVSVEILSMNENTNDYAFNEKNSLYGQKIFYKTSLNTLHSRISHFSLYHYIENNLSNEKVVKNYQQLFLLGEKNVDIQDDYHQLSQFSLVHLFALSGMHIHVLYSILKRIFGLFFKQKGSMWLSYLCIGCYVFSIPMQISLYRAFFTLVLNQCFKKWFNEYDVLSMLIIASFFYNPYIIYNISFIFSYFIYFIVLITKNMKYSTFLIYFSSIPIVLCLNARISLLSFIIGYCLTPFIEFFYTVCCLNLLLPIFEPILQISVYMLRTIIQLLKGLSLFLSLSYPHLGFIILFYILFFNIIIQLNLRRRIHTYVSMILALCITFSIYSQYKIYGEVTMIDVGQGDCTLIRLPMNQGNILIDTGGNKDYDIATKTIIPYLQATGIHCLDYVYISHDDYDHCGALESLVEHFEVKHVIKEFEEYREIGCMKVRMLKGNQTYVDENDQSLIMYIQLPAMKLLFMGDASQEVEADLKTKYQNLDVDVLKVSHHGSATSTSPVLFEMIHPTIAMIGVKKNNIYKHPSATVIERLKRKNVTVLRTDEDGMFHIRFYGKYRYILR